MHLISSLPPLSPGQHFGLALNGLPLTGRDPDGVVWSVKKPLKGWSGRTGSTGKATQRAYQDGAWVDRAYATGRTLVVPGDLRVRPDVGAGGEQHLKLVAALDQLMGRLPGDDPAPFVVDEDGLRRHAMARLDGEPSDPIWVNPWLVRYGFQLFAPDYRRLAGDGSGPTHSVTVGLPFTEGGRVRPYSLPSTINATVVSGSVTVANAGNAPAPITVTFDGPVPRPSVRSAVTGRSQWFDLDVLPGQSLVVDQDAHTVLLNGVGRGNTMRGEWLDPVPDDVLVFDSAAYSPDARMTVSWFDSWK